MQRKDQGPPPLPTYDCIANVEYFVEIAFDHKAGTDFLCTGHGVQLCFR